jgi:hypothetical protein
LHFIVADTAGTGTLVDRNNDSHDLDPFEWLETDSDSTITAGDGIAYVRYRDDGHTVEVAPGQTYRIETPMDNVIDIRSATPAAEEIVAALENGTDGDRILRAIRTAPDDQSHGDWIRQLYFQFEHHTGRNLDDVLLERLSKEEFDEAMHLLVL